MIFFLNRPTQSLNTTTLSFSIGLDKPISHIFHPLCWKIPLGVAGWFLFSQLFGFNSQKVLQHPLSGVRPQWNPLVLNRPGLQDLLPWVWMHLRHWWFFNCLYVKQGRCREAHDQLCLLKFFLFFLFFPLMISECIACVMFMRKFCLGMISQCIVCVMISHVFFFFSYSFSSSFRSGFGFFFFLKTKDSMAFQKIHIQKDAERSIWSDGPNCKIFKNLNPYLQIILKKVRNLPIQIDNIL